MAPISAANRSMPTTSNGMRYCEKIASLTSAEVLVPLVALAR